MCVTVSVSLFWSVRANSQLFCRRRDSGAEGEIENHVGFWLAWLSSIRRHGSCYRQKKLCMLTWCRKIHGGHEGQAIHRLPRLPWRLGLGARAICYP